MVNIVIIGTLCHAITAIVSWCLNFDRQLKGTHLALLAVLSDLLALPQQLHIPSTTLIREPKQAHQLAAPEATPHILRRRLRVRTRQRVAHAAPKALAKRHAAHA